MMQSMKTPRDQIIHQLIFYPKKRKELFLSLSGTERASILLKLSKRVQKEILKLLDNQQIIATIEHLDIDEMVDMLLLLSPKRQEKITSELSQAMQQNIAFLSKFDPQTAAGLMNINFIQVEHSDTIKEVAGQFKTHEKRTGRLPVIIVTDGGRAVGYLPGHSLGLASPDENLDKYIKKLIMVDFDASHRSIIKQFGENPHSPVAVIGTNGNILGVIFTDDILRLNDMQSDHSLYNFAGVSKEESISDSIAQKVKSRYKWLLINLCMAFLVSSVVSLFGDTISKYVLLAVYMPIVAGMGGSAGTQTLAVMVRGISLKQIKLENAWVALRREVSAGFTNGVIIGLTVAMMIMIINRDPQLAIILGLAMTLALTVSGFFGTLVPLIMHKLGKDPAASATVFITMATDMFGFMSFLWLATVLLE